MKMKTAMLLLLVCMQSFAQQKTETSPFDPTHWGVVLDHPQMKNVVVKQDIAYHSDDKGSLHIDVYLPPRLKAGEKLPAVIFLNGIGETPNRPKVKSWGIYKTWPQLMAANGFVGISMESDRNGIPESFQKLFKFLSDKGATYNIDAQRIGVYAASANVTQSARYLMTADAYPGIKAAVLYYGGIPAGPYRKNLPVLFVVAEGDVRGNNTYASLWSEVLKNKAPWTISMASELPHAFDAFEDTDAARKMVKETISFWRNHLEPVPAPSWPPSKEREIVAAQFWQNHAKVAAMLKEWFQKNPGSKDAAALGLYAGALRNTRQYSEAETINVERLKIEPENLNALFDMVFISHALNKPTEAESYFSRAKKVGNIPRFFLTGLGFSLMGIKKYQEAIPLYEEALTMSPNGVDYYNLACAYSVSGNSEKAFDALKKAIANGYAVKQQFETDEDLKVLRSDERWKEIAGKLN